MRIGSRIMNIENLRIPVIASPMFLVSGPEIVKACCRNGIVGTFPALNCRTTEEFENWIIEISKDLDDYALESDIPRPIYGVNLIVHRSNPRVQSDLEICIKHKVPLIITSLGAVSDLVDAVHSYGGLVYHDIIKRRHAEKAVEVGVDGLICVSAGAGGHAGSLHPMVLVEEVRRIFEGKIVLAGCLSTGRDVAAALQMGADMAYMGTRFINTIESSADQEYKEMISHCTADQIVYTDKVSGIMANFMQPSLEKAGYDVSKLNEGHAEFAANVSEEARAWKTVWSAGQGVSSINETLSVEALVNEIEVGFIDAMKEQVEKYKLWSEKTTRKKN